MVSYDPLWKTMKEKNITQYRLIQQGIDRHVLNRLKNNSNVHIVTIEKLCTILDCTPNDVVEFKKGGKD